MKLIAQKPCSFGGHKFVIGDEIPVELVANPNAQEKMGVLAISVGADIAHTELQKATAQVVGEIKFEIPIHTEAEDIVLVVTNEELTVFTDIRQIGVRATEDKQKISEMIQKIESEDLLILLDALDGRKHVKEEAQARAQARAQALEEIKQQPPDDDITGQQPPDDEEGKQSGGDD